ncbi:MAG: zf-HC2 domain-containing protein [Nocardioidaceae bacterium]
MTQSNHQSAERISELLDGGLPAAEALEVNAHLAGCAECREIRESLLAVTTLLADVGASREAMPDDVVARVDAALARVGTERAAGVRRLEPELVRRPPARRPLTWLAGAAAAVVIAAVGVAGLKSLPSQDADTAATGGRGADSRVTDQRGTSAVPSAVPSGGSAGASGEGEPGHESTLDYLTATDIPAAARRLAAAPKQLLPTDDRCAAPVVGDRSTVVRFDGRRAVLSIMQDTRTATVLDCATGTRSLLVTGY